MKLLRTDSRLSMLSEDVECYFEMPICFCHGAVVLKVDFVDDAVIFEFCNIYNNVV